MSDREELIRKLSEGAKLCSWCGVTHKLGENTLCPTTSRIEELKKLNNALRKRPYSSEVTKLRDEINELEEDNQSNFDRAQASIRKHTALVEGLKIILAMYDNGITTDSDMADDIEAAIKKYGDKEAATRVVRADEMDAAPYLFKGKDDE